MKQLSVTDKDGHTYPIGTYKNKTVTLIVPYITIDRVMNKEDDYVVFEIYGTKYRLNYKQINKSPRSVYQLSRLG